MDLVCVFKEKKICGFGLKLGKNARALLRRATCTKARALSKECTLGLLRGAKLMPCYA